jgi:hypothetical protein
MPDTPIAGDEIMARIRSIKPETWSSEQIMELSIPARLLFIGMWNFCDDGGNHPASSKTLKAEIFPSDDMMTSDIQQLVDEVLAQGLLIEYEAGEKRYWHVTGWKHQKIDKPSYKHPAPPEEPHKQGTSGLFDDDSSNGSGSSTPGVEGSGVESKGVERKGGRSSNARKIPIPPDFAVSERVATWATENGHSRLQERLDHFIGKAKANGYAYVDWDAAFMGAIREDWAKLTTVPAGVRRADPRQSENERRQAEALRLLGDTVGDQNTIEMERIA